MQASALSIRAQASNLTIADMAQGQTNDQQPETAAENQEGGTQAQETASAAVEAGAPMEAETSATHTAAQNAGMAMREGETQTEEHSQEPRDSGWARMRFEAVRSETVRLTRTVRELSAQVERVTTREQAHTAALTQGVEQVTRRAEALIAQHTFDTAAAQSARSTRGEYEEREMLEHSAAAPGMDAAEARPVQEAESEGTNTAAPHEVSTLHERSVHQEEAGAREESAASEEPSQSQVVDDEQQGSEAGEKESQPESRSADMESVAAVEARLRAVRAEQRRLTNTVMGLRARIERLRDGNEAE